MVTAATQFPEEHASLSDGSTTVKFIFTDGQGAKNERAFKAAPYPRTALKTSQGESKYSDLEPPYFAIAQDDFTGGRGNEDFENDTSRYSDGYHIDTSKESGVVISGQEQYSFTTSDERQMPGDVAWQALYSGTNHISRTFTADGNMTARYWKLLLKTVGSPANIHVEIWSDSGGDPNVQLNGSTVGTGSADVVSGTYQIAFTSSLTDTTVYHVVVHATGSPDASNHWLVGCDSGVTGKQSSDGSSWSSLSNGLYYHISPDIGDRTHLFFEYKSGLYMISRLDSGTNSALYINGDRGAADSNVGDKSTLVDATKSGTWVADRYIGAMVLITKGPGSEELQPWRNIIDNDGTTLTVSPNWNITHTTSTEYVIIGSDYWRQLDSNLGDYITDVAVAGEYIWMARGGAEGDNGLHRIRYYNASGGVWTTDEEDASNSQISERLLAINHPSSGETLYSSTTEHAFDEITIYKGKVGSGTISEDEYLFHPIYEFETETPWDDVTIANATQSTVDGNTRISIASGHTTGIAAVRNLDAPLNMREGDALVALIQSDVNLDDGDYKWSIDDVEDMGKTWSPVKVFLEDYAYDDQPLKVYHLDEMGASPTYTDLPETYDGINSNHESITIETDDRILIGYDKPFDSVYFDVGTVNANAVNMAIYYWNGDNIAAVANISDGTETGSDTPLGQDGTISWDMPGETEWRSQTINSVEAYWIQIGFDGALTPPITINRIVIYMNDSATLAPEYYDLTNAYDGNSATDSQLTLAIADYLYVGYSTKFNKITVGVGTANDIASVMTGAYFNGSVWTSVAITDGTDSSGDTLKVDGDITFSIPNDWESNTVNSTETYWIRLDVSVALTTVFSINEITVTRQNNSAKSIPAVTASEWTTVISPFLSTPTIPDLSSIKSISLFVQVDKGVNTFQIRRLWLAKKAVEVADETSFKMPGNNRIMGMEAYAGNVDDPITNPWIFTTDAVYEMQTQNDDQIVKIPLEELGALSSPENGLGHTVNGTYIYFNIGEKIERYFNRTLDDIGPDRDEGLPDPGAGVASRKGIPVTMASYPARVYAGIDAGVSGRSSALALDGTAWHEIYRAIESNERIRNIQVQSIPGTNVDRLWLSTNNDVPYVPISLNPYNDTDYTYQPEGVLITSWIYANLLDVVKLWKSLKIFAENINSSRYIVADYQVDTDTTWTEIGTYDTAPVEEIDIASTLPQAKRIRYRLRFITDSAAESPRLKAIVTEGVAFVPVKYQYSWTFAIKQDTEDIDLLGVYDLATTSVEDYDQLVTWANGGTPLTMRNHSTLYDDKTVFIDPISVSPIKIVDNEGIENHVAALTCIEV